MFRETPTIMAIVSGTHDFLTFFNEQFIGK